MDVRALIVGTEAAAFARSDHGTKAIKNLQEDLARKTAHLLASAKNSTDPKCAWAAAEYQHTQELLEALTVARKRGTDGE